MKSRMKCVFVLALIAFGFGYTDLLVRPCWAHNNGSRAHLLLHGVDHAVHDAINDASDAVDAAVDAVVEELNEWADSGGEVIHFVSSLSFSSGNSNEEQDQADLPSQYCGRCEKYHNLNQDCNAANHNNYGGLNGELDGS